MLEDRVLLDVALTADNRVRPDASAALDDGAFVDEAGAFERHRFLDAGACSHPDLLALARERRRTVPAVHDVTVDLSVFLRRADIDPVAAIHKGHEGLVTLDERRKEAALDRPRGVLGNAMQRVR